MPRYIWSRLNKQQVGAFTEYFVKMEMTMCGFQVYGTEVDDRGIDFVARFEQNPFIEIQVKSLRSTGYVFMQKEKFLLGEYLYLALGLLLDGQPPDLYLIPSVVWKQESAIFVSRDYEGLKSKPEWGLNISKKNMPLLEPYRFEKVVEAMVNKTANNKVQQTQKAAPLIKTLVRQAKLGASCRVKVPVGQGLASHPYRVLRDREG